MSLGSAPRALLCDLLLAAAESAAWRDMLGRARLLPSRVERPDTDEDHADARRLIFKDRYLRRELELVDAEAAILDKSEDDAK